MSDKNLSRLFTCIKTIVCTYASLDSGGINVVKIIGLTVNPEFKFKMRNEKNQQFCAS
jgi:hypothetical protein